MLDSLVRVSRRVGWMTDLLAVIRTLTHAEGCAPSCLLSRGDTGMTARLNVPPQGQSFWAESVGGPSYGAFRPPDHVPAVAGGVTDHGRRGQGLERHQRSSGRSRIDRRRCGSMLPGLIGLSPPCATRHGGLLGGGDFVTCPRRPTGDASDGAAAGRTRCCTDRNSASGATGCVPPLPFDLR